MTKIDLDSKVAENGQDSPLVCSRGVSRTLSTPNRRFLAGWGQCFALEADFERRFQGEKRSKLTKIDLDLKVAENGQDSPLVRSRGVFRTLSTPNHRFFTGWGPCFALEAGFVRRFQGEKR